MNGKIVGVLILSVVIIIGGLFYIFKPIDSQKPATTLKGFIGGEKAQLFDDEAVQRQFAAKYGIAVNYSKAGSIEMVKLADPANTDFLFPSSQTALELFKASRAEHLVKSEIVLNSPIVLFSWDSVTDGLVRAGIARQAGTHYEVDLPKLVALIEAEKRWTDIGVPDLYGKIAVISTDPAKSNSGNQFAALVANVMVGDVVNESTLPTVLPRLTKWFSKVGYMEHSSSVLFEQYLRTGMGSKPIIAAYENQLIEFAVYNPDVWAQAKDRIRILYPVPTMWSAHTVIATTAKGEALIKALSDKDIQKIAWERHGFRTGLTGSSNDPAALKVTGIAPGVTQITPLPKPEIMEAIIQALSAN